MAKESKIVMSMFGRITEEVDRRLDALSLEVDQKLRSLRNQYSQLERKEEHLRR